MNRATWMVSFSLLLFGFLPVALGQESANEPQAADGQESAAAQESSDKQASAESSSGLQQGQIALVVREGAELMQKDDVLLRMRVGTEFTVQEVRDEWIGGLVRLEEAPRTGWVRPGDLVPLDEAYPRFRDMLSSSPRNYELLLVNARLLRDQEKLDEAEKLYDRAVAADPRDKRALLQRGYLHYLQKEYEQAVEDYSRALKIDPQDVLAYTNRGLNRQALGQLEQALEDYERALERNDRNALALNNAAWLRATAEDDALRDAELAVAFARTACELTNHQNFDFLDTLAAAHAEAGQFDEARKHIALAIKQAPEPYQAELRKRQTLYEQNKPYRDESLKQPQQD